MQEESGESYKKQRCKFIKTSRYDMKGQEGDLKKFTAQADDWKNTSWPHIENKIKKEKGQKHQQ